MAKPRPVAAQRLFPHLALFVFLAVALTDFVDRLRGTVELPASWTQRHLDDVAVSLA